MKDVNKHEASLVDEHGELYQESRYDMSRNSGLLRQYICGGRGIVTLENIDTKIHHTYEFRRPNNPEEFDDHIVIYAVAHTKRKPGYWRERLNDTVQ